MMLKGLEIDEKEYNDNLHSTGLIENFQKNLQQIVKIEQLKSL